MSLQKLANLLKGAEKTFDEFQVEYFAKKASNDYINKKASLNDSIKKIAQEEKLNTEQIKRICETANHTINQHLFDTQDDKNVYFEVADVNNIEMSNTLDKVAHVEISDYDFSPNKHKETIEKIASTNDYHKKAFNEKLAFIDDWEISALDPKLTLLNLKEKIAAVNELAREKREANEYKIKEAHWKLYNLVKDELQESPYFKVAQVIAVTTDRHEILEDITEQLLDNKVITDEDVFAVVKVAGEFDKEHPIVKWTEKYASLLLEQELLFGAEKETEQQLKILAQEIK